MNAIKIRKSVRNFKAQALSDDDIVEIQSYLDIPENLTGPFGNYIKLTLVLDNKLNKNEKPGTYGAIHNAQGYILGSCRQSKQAIFDYGYALEGLVLYLTSMGIGTCWLAGTINRQEIYKHMSTKDGEIIPAITPVGYPMENMHLLERVMRTVIKADQRKPAEELFFYGDFNVPFNDRAKRYIKPLKYVQLAPSARNIQPWRVLISSDLSRAHFYIVKTDSKEKNLVCQPEYIDIGIAYRHFAEGMDQKGKIGEFLSDEPEVLIASNMEYIATWRKVKKGSFEDAE